METYRGHVRSPADAIKLFEACRLGLLPRVQRRLSEKERQSITSGSVFVWDEREAGMRRWTDGKSWSASRVSGSFLTYREMEGKRGGGNFVPAPTRRTTGKTPESGRGSDEDADMDGEGPDGYRYKPDGLMKQSFSITTSAGQHLHLISYYARPHANTAELPTPTTDPQLRHITPTKGMYPESTIHDQQGPAVTRSPMAGAYMHPQHHQQGPPPPPPRGYAYPMPQSYGAWPPSPMSASPYPYPPPPMYGTPLPPNPNGHPSPRFSPHQQHLPPVQPHPHQQAHPQQTIFDRAPPPLQDASLPPPPPRTAHISYTPSPAPILAAQAQQQAQQAQRLHQTREPSPAAPQAPAQPQAPSQNIPSISSLVHAEDTAPHTNGSTSTHSSPKAVGEPTASPNTKDEKATEGGGPKDIPVFKLAPFGGEDNRALRVLDRKFHV